MSSNKFQLISIIALGFVLFGGFLLFSADFAFAATPTLSSTCGGVTGDGSSNPTGMVSPGGPFINLSWSAVPFAGEFEDGSTAFKRGDYETALAMFTKAANKGDASAQFNLGLMYAKGLGVDANQEDALRWIKKSADLGFAPAKQYLKNAHTS